MDNLEVVRDETGRIKRGNINRFQGHSRRTALMMSRLEGMTPHAIKNLERLMTCGNPAVELGATKEILDRTMGKVRQKVDVSVTDTAQALFDVDDYKAFVLAQIEAAVRTIGARYPYDDFTHQEVTLRGNHDQVGGELRLELMERLRVAGITVDECGFTHLAYAQEIAGAMLRRQQAEAVVAARKTLVEGAVGMVEMALEMLSAKNVVELDDERRAAMVSNLMVVLCGERDTQPVVNTGTLYS